MTINNSPDVFWWIRHLYQSLQPYGFVRIFTEKHNLLWIENAEYGSIHKTPAPPILMNVLHYRIT